MAFDSQIIQTITVVALIIGILAFLSHTHGRSFHFPQISSSLPDVRHDMADLYRNRHLSKKLSANMTNLRREADSLNEHPQDAGNVLLQLRRMLPAEGYLTERMAQLRAKAHRIKNGHIARLQETRNIFTNLPVSVKKKAAAELSSRYNQLIGIDTRLERLDKSVAENEKHIKGLTHQAQAYTVRYNHKKLADCLKSAEKLQKHNSHLFRFIERTEKKLTATSKLITPSPPR